MFVTLTEFFPGKNIVTVSCFLAIYSAEFDIIKTFCRFYSNMVSACTSLKFRFVGRFCCQLYLGQILSLLGNIQ